MASIQESINQPSRGLHLDMYAGNLDPSNAYTYAFNVRQESEDGQQYNLSNEPSNTIGVQFPEGTKVIGHLNMPELKYTVYWLANPITGDCIIGTVTNDTIGCVDNLDPQADCDCDCDDAPCVSNTPCRQFIQVLSAPCLNFSIEHRIKKAVYNLTNKTTEVYWTDDYNPPMWVDFQNLPLVNGVIDCNLMRIFPDFKVPTIRVIEENGSGSLVTGSYQFLVAYTNSKGNELSQYYSPTNPTSIWRPINSGTFDFETGKAIKIVLDNLDVQYRYFNIAVQKNIDGVSSFEVCGTFNLTAPEYTYVYTGNDKTPRLLTTDEIYFKAPYYNKAATLETQNQTLMLGNLTTSEELNYQGIASAIRLQWETWQLPYNRFEAYNKGSNSANIRGYLRDEVYAFDVVFLLSNGRYTDRFHIPGRAYDGTDISIVTGADTAAAAQDPCNVPTGVPKWQVYNTGAISGTNSQYVAGDDCYVGPYQYGEFGYWESSNTYPDIPVFGALQGQPIRHHKFPDELICPRYSSDPTNNIGAEHMVYPIGVKLDPQNIQQAIANSGLTQEQKEQIVGVKIVRGNRSQNKSIQARGILFNVGEYNYQGQNYLYPNYCFNDLNSDPFISNGAINAQGAWVSAVPPRETDYSVIQQNRLDGFGREGIRYTFMSPDTSFSDRPLDGALRLESVEFGKATAHIVQVQDNPRYTIGTQKGVKVAAMMAVATIFAYDFGFDVATQIGDVSSITTTPRLALNLDISQFLPAFNTAYDLIRKLTPAEQYGYQYNAVGNYCQSIAIPNAGNKVRSIDVAGYISPGMLTLPGEVLPLNNFQRESSVYIRTTGSLPYPHELGGPVDNSRFTFGSYNAETGIWLTDGQRVQRDISSFYATIKRFVPDQYGQIYSYQTVDTGYLQYLDNNALSYPTVFGGDTFINRFADKRKLPFFVSNTWGKGDDTDVSYDMLGNVGCPTYYLTTGPVDPSVGGIINYFNDIYNMFIPLPGVLLTLVTGGLLLFLTVLIGIVRLVVAIVNNLGLKNVTLDRHHDDNYFEKGVMYLWAYGIPYFFVESDVNCDYRQAGTTLDQDFFPNVGTDIPDYWLQEINVSVDKDNYHLYNRSLSKQNIENYFDHLPVDYAPDKPLATHHATRIIYSEQTNLSELQNNWLVYRPNNLHDLPLTEGELVDLNGVEQDRVLALTEDVMSVYNAFITLATDIKGAIFGNDSMFNNPPQEFSSATLGYGGTQNCTFTKTPFGHFWVDAMRGDVFKYSPTEGLQAISHSGVRNWLKENLPFHIAKSFPGYNTDNSYNGAGLTMVWDSRYERLILTKKDYIPLDKDIQWNDTDGLYIQLAPPSCPDGYSLSADGNTCTALVRSEVSVVPSTKHIQSINLYDPNYFCDASWTIAYAPSTQSWVSFYGFKPNYYVEQTNYFQSGTQVSGNSLWDHLLTNKCYQTFYNNISNFDIETITKADAKDQTLMSVAYRNEVLRYTNSYDWKSMQGVTFNEAVCYTMHGTSGNLHLHLRDKSNLTDGLFAVPDSGFISIPVSEVSNVWRFNKFMDIVKDVNCVDPMMLYSCANDIKEVNSSAIDYSIINDMGKRKRLKSDWFKIRLRNNKKTRYKFIFKFLQSKDVQTTR